MDPWYTTAIVYAVDVKRFYDADEDGIGDFRGLIAKLDYIKALGVNTIWLLPFQPSPGKDNGYDVVDYYGVDTRVGTAGDFVEFMHEAKKRGLHVIMDLVINHSSDEHPWFIASRKRMPRYENYYVWKDEVPEDTDNDVAYPGVQDSVWKYDQVRKQHYYHTFLDFQPDLNIRHPDVLREIDEIMGFWLQLGVDGFRIDGAAPMTRNKRGGDERDPEQSFRSMRRSLALRKGDGVLMAESDDQPDRLWKYYGDGDRFQLVFDFTTNQHIYLSLARGSSEPLRYSMAMLPVLPRDCRWVRFLRTMDELNLAQLSEDQRNEVFARFAPAKDARLYDRGARRRLAPLLDGDQRLLRLVHSLLLSLPGVPLLMFGDEIGMGDDLSLHDRESVRTAMQWDSGPNGGFSSIKRSDIHVPILDKEPFGFKNVNVASQYNDDDSLMNFVKRAIHARVQCPEIAADAFTILGSEDGRLFVHRFAGDGTDMIIAHNFSDEKITTQIKSEELEGAQDVFSDQEYQPPKKNLIVGPYGFRWLRVMRDD